MTDQPSLDILALGDRFSAAYRSIEDVTRSIGKVTFHSEHAYAGVDEAISHIRNSSFEAVMMPNPYGNERRLAIYRRLREIDFPVIAFDRGGLPDSWFFDSGFNADSPTYRMSEWDKPLTAQEEVEIEAYIHRLRNSASALEAQGERVGGQVLRARLGLQGKKVLFVPFQRPSDTTIKFFAGSLKGWGEFVSHVEEIAALCEGTAPEWVVIGKRHPLETENPTHRINLVPEGVHIHDLLEMSDAVCLVNSGVGLLAAAFDKPVFHFGEAYYSHPMLNRRVHSPDEVVICLRNLAPKIDTGARNALFHHLKNRVYSFGVSKMELIRQSDGSLRNITRHIDFAEVRLPAAVRRPKKKFFL